MAKVTIKRRNVSERADGRAALYAVLNIERKKIQIPVKIAVTAEEWDAVGEKVKGRGQHAKDCNLIISNVKARITDILVKARLSDQQVTKDWFLAAYRQPGKTVLLYDFARRHLSEIESALTWSTYRHHMAALNKLNAYRPDLRIDEITPEFLRVYAAYLRDHHNNNTGTIGKNLSIIRVHYYAAMRAGIVSNNPFEVYKIPGSKPAVIYLTEEELNVMLELFRSGTLPDNENDALRFFLFMTFTAMHITDARNLQIDQIFGGEIHYRRVKTGVEVCVPLSKPAEILVDFYRGKRGRGRLFLNLPTDQAFNRLIKIVCEKAGIRKAVSAKAARHTFATLYYKKNNGDLGTLSRLLGHTSVTTTMIYAHIMKDSRVQGVKAFDDFIK